MTDQARLAALEAVAAAAREELIAALEAATGPSYEKDALIWNEIGRPDTRTHDGTPCVLTYTASIDAALTLVPDEWTAWEIRSRLRKTHFRAEVSRLEDVHRLDAEVLVEGDGPTPALAICIAALRARAYIGDKNEPRV